MLCEKCGKELSKNEGKCPHCGHPVSKKKEILPEVIVSNHRFKKDELMYYIVNLVALLSCFLPYAKASMFGASVSYISEDGFF